MLKPLEQADSQSAAEARNLADRRRLMAFGNMVVESLPPAVVQAPLDYAAVRIGGFIKLTARLAELDMSAQARWDRAFTLQLRLAKIKPDAPAVPVSLYYAVDSEATRKQSAGRVSIGGQVIGYAKPVILEGDPDAASQYERRRAGIVTGCPDTIARGYGINF